MDPGFAQLSQGWIARTAFARRHSGTLHGCFDRDKTQPQNTATPTSSSCPPARHCQACLGLLVRRAVCWLPAGEKRGAPWRGQARCVQVRAATFLVISPTGRRGRRVPPGFPTPLFFRLTQKRPFFVPGVYLRGLAPEAPVASAGAWRCLGGADGATPGRAAATFSGSRALWGACACGISEGPNRTR